MKKIIYLDNAATTKPCAESLKKATALYEAAYFNPSALYREGRSVKSEIDLARGKIQKAFPSASKLIFTSCGTEADNMAIFGFAGRGNVVTTQGEHSAVYNSFMRLKERGVEVRFARLTEGGFVDEKDLLSKIDEKTSFVSVSHVNNETGAVNNINRISAEVKKIAPKAIFHSDGVQAFGKIPVTLSPTVSLYSISAHKIGGVKGVGALVINDKINIQPYLVGGGQEGGLRSGTENVLGIIDFGLVCEDALSHVAERFDYVKNLNDLFVSLLDRDIYRLISTDHCSPYIVCLSGVGLRGAVLQNMMNDDGILIGTGSACSSKSPHSRIISSFINDRKVLDGVIRISFSPFTTESEIRQAVEKLNTHGRRLKSII